MRIVFECYAIYAAMICTVLTLILALGFSDEKIEWVAKKVINISFLLYGPVQVTVCAYGCTEFNALSRICTLHGITNETNYVSIFVLLSTLVFSVGVTFMLAMEQTLDMAQQSFSNEQSVIYKLTAFYFQYTIRSRERRKREQRRERRFSRHQREQ